IKIKSDSLRIVVTVCCYNPQSCVDTYGLRRQASSHLLSELFQGEREKEKAWFFVEPGLFCVARYVSPVGASLLAKHS
ncbi:hypothetical protein, partial [Pseudomonas fluorescens]|uniref:hypothetical protein n=1 Tax=Pseudomonas fluorescens TaxID=294 RepID=UPI001C4E270A